MSKIRKLSIGDSPKDPNTFHYVIGSAITFVVNRQRMHGIISKIVHHSELARTFGTNSFDIFVDVEDEGTNTTDRVMWKQLTVGTNGGVFIERDLGFQYEDEDTE